MPSNPTRKQQKAAEAQRETEILRRMLSTPPKPHKPKPKRVKKQTGQPKAS